MTTRSHLLIGMILLATACKKEEDDTPQPGTPGPTTQQEPTVTDIDGNSYRIITIGGRTWMAENLRTARYRNGALIPYIADLEDWYTTTTGACCAYEGSYINDLLFGKLYNGYAVLDPSGLCPLGWHVATDEEYQEMESALGMPEAQLGVTGYRGTAESVGRQLKDSLTWALGAEPGTNASGFSALPGGYRAGGFVGLALMGQWWTTTAIAQSSLITRELHRDNAGIRRFNSPIGNGCCVRCIQDE